MHLTKKLSQYRRDFQGIYTCEHCGHQQTSHGYDDDYFHTHVIPSMRCTNCDRIAEPTTPTSTPDVPAWTNL